MQNDKKASTDFDAEKDRTATSGLSKKGTRAHPNSNHGFKARITLDRKGVEEDKGATKARDKAYDLGYDIGELFVTSFQSIG